LLSLLVVKSLKISIYDDNKLKKFLEQVSHVHLKMVNYINVRFQSFEIILLIR